MSICLLYVWFSRVNAATKLFNLRSKLMEEQWQTRVEENKNNQAADCFRENHQIKKEEAGTEQAREEQTNAPQG